jgi:hypothetical protein
MISVKAVQAMKIESVVTSLSMKGTHPVPAKIFRTSPQAMPAGSHGHDRATDFF